jgi:hypothetical protein
VIDRIIDNKFYAPLFTAVKRGIPAGTTERGAQEPKNRGRATQEQL